MQSPSFRRQGGPTKTKAPFRGGVFYRVPASAAVEDGDVASSCPLQIDLAVITLPRTSPYGRGAS
jgi:hypothetical protein